MYLGLKMVPAFASLAIHDDGVAGGLASDAAAGTKIAKPAPTNGGSSTNLEHDGEMAASSAQESKAEDALVDPFLPVTTPFSPGDVDAYVQPAHLLPATLPTSPGFENAPSYGFADIIISPTPTPIRTNVDEDAVSHYLKQLQDRATNSPNTLFEPLKDYLPLTEKGVPPFVGSEDGGYATEEYEKWQMEVKRVEKKRVEAIREAHERLRASSGEAAKDIPGTLPKEHTMGKDSLAADEES